MPNKKLQNFIREAKQTLIKSAGCVYYEDIGQSALSKARDLIDYENYSNDCKAITEFEKFIFNIKKVYTNK